MSFDLHWRPMPRSFEDVEGAYQLKWALANRFGDHDGSCKEDFGVLHEDLVPWLEGVRDGAGTRSELAEEAQRLIDCLRANPQGVRVWIGGEDD